MATVLRFLSYRVVIYPNDHRPCHVHVMDTDCEAVFELGCPSGPPILRINFRFPKKTLSIIQRNLADNLAPLCREWRKIHGHY